MSKGKRPHWMKNSQRPGQVRNIRPNNDMVIRCSFCTRPKGTMAVLLEGALANICNDCIVECATAIKEIVSKNLTPEQWAEVEAEKERRAKESAANQGDPNNVNEGQPS